MNYYSEQIVDGNLSESHVKYCIFEQFNVL